MSGKHKAKKSIPATKAERAGIKFEPIKQSFTWTNNDWGHTFLPRIRLATVALQKDRPELKDLVKGVIEDGMLPDLLDGWIATRDHLVALVETVDAALSRSYLVLEDLGFTPENPPPDNVIKLRPRA